MWVENNTPATLGFDLIVREDFVVPDPSTVAVLKIRTRNGTITHTETVTNPVGSNLVFMVPNTVNVLSGSNTSEIRSAALTYMFKGTEQLLVQHYTVTQYIGFTVTPQGVRTLIGLDNAELEDHEIDLISAYYALAAQNGTTFTTAFATEGYKGNQANKAVLLQAAIDLAISIPQRLAQKTEEEKASFQRLTKLDPYKLMAKLDTELGQVLDTLKDTTLVVIGAAAFRVAQPTIDPFTGA